MAVLALNQEVVRALGFGEVKQVTRLTLDILPGKPPTVTVEKLLTPAEVDKLATVVEVFRLEPKAEAK